MKYVTLFCFLACFACNSLMAQSKIDVSPSELIQREQLKQEQKNIEASYASKEADCYKKFSVNPCIDKARIERNTALTENKRRELVLNDLKREEKKQSVLKIPKTISPNPKPTDDADRKLLSKEMIDQNKRIDSAKARVETANQKKREAQAKASQRSKKNVLSADVAAKYREKLTAAEAHKTSLEQKNAGNAKPKASTLPIPKDVTN
ncbi:MAG: hypothetical protein ABIO88_10780 [Burkholderiaceae bacterium]